MRRISPGGRRSNLATTIASRAARFACVSVALFSVACAGVSSTKSAQTPDEIAQETKKLLDEAERKLDATLPGEAESLLKQAGSQLTRPELATHPKAPLLKTRHKSISDRVPEVKQEAEKKAIQKAKDALASSMEAAKSAAEEVGSAETEDAFKKAREALATAQKLLDENAPFEGKDDEYKKAAKTSKKELRDLKKSVEKRWTEVEAIVQTNKLNESFEALESALAEAKGAEAGEEELTKADDALKTATEAIDSAKGIARKDKKLKKLHTAKKTRLKAAGKELKQFRVQYEVRGQQKKVAEAKTAVTTALADLKPPFDEDSFKTAESAVQALDAALKAGRSLERKDNKYKAVAAAAKNAVKQFKGQIKARKLAKGVDGQKAAVEAALTATKEAMAALSGTPEDEKFEQAKQAVDNLKKTLNAGNALARKDKAYGAYAQKLKNGITAQKEQIKRRQNEVKVARKRAEIEAARTNVAEKLKALVGTPDAEAFSAAETAVKELKNSLGKTSSLAAKDPKFGRFVTMARNEVTAHKGTIKRRRGEVSIALKKNGIENARKNVTEKLAALKGMPKPEAFADAKKAVSDLKGELKGTAAFAARDGQFAKYVAVVQNEVKRHEGFVTARRGQVDIAEKKAAIDEARAAATEKIAALNDEPKPSDFQAATEAVKAVAKSLVGAERFMPKDRGFARHVAITKNEIKRNDATIERRQVEVAITAHRVKVEAAKIAAQESLTAMKGGDPDPAAVKNARTAVKKLEEQLAAGKDLAGKDRKYGMFLAAQNRTLTGFSAGVDGGATAVAVRDHKSKVEAATAAVQEKLAALEGKPDPSLYQKAEDAITELTKILDKGDEVAAKDRTHAAFVAGTRRAIPGYRIQIRRQRVETAKEKVKERFDALAEDPKPADFKAAEQAVRLLENSTKSAQSFQQKDRPFTQYLAVTTREIAAHKAAIIKRRIEADVAKHRAKIDAALAALAERMKALEEEQPKAAEFAAAEKSLVKLEDEIGSGEPVAAKDRAYAGFLVGLKKQIATNRFTINRRKVEVEIAGHRAKVDAAKQAMEERMAALAEDPKPADFAAAAKSVDALEKVLDSGKETAAKDKKYAGYLAGLRRSVAIQRLGIKRSQDAAAVAKHRSAIDAAATAVQEKLGALQEEEPPEAAFGSAEAAVDALAKVLEAGKENAAKDKKHAGFLAVMNRRVPAFKGQIARRKTQVEIAGQRKKVEGLVEAVGEKLSALSDEPKPADFDAAESTVGALEKAIAAAKPLAPKDRKFNGFLIVSGRKIPGYKGVINRRRTEVEVAQHRAKVEAAQEALAERMRALESEPTPANFAAVEKAAASLSGQLTSGDAVGKKDRKYNAALIAWGRKVAADKAGIERKKIEVEVGKHRAKVEATTAKVAEKLEALSENPKPVDFKNAERAVESLESVLAGGKSTGAKDKKYAGYLAVNTRKIPAYKRTIDQRRFEQEVAHHRTKVEREKSAVEQALESLEGQPKASAYQKAEDNITQLLRVVEAGSELAAKDKKYAAFLNGVRNSVPISRMTIRQQRVDSAKAALEKRIEALAGEPDPEDFAAAEKAHRLLANSTEAAKKLSERNKAYNQFLAQAARNVIGLKAAIQRRRVEVEISTHRRKVEKALGAVNNRLTALEEKPDKSDFAVADRAVTELSDEIKSGEPTAAKDKKYAAYLAGLRKQAAGFSAQIKRRRVEVKVEAHKEKVEAARAKMQERMGTLFEGRPQLEDFNAAEEAAATLITLVDSGKPIAELSQPYGKYLAGMRRAVAVDRGKIERRDTEVAVLNNRERIDAAVANITEKIAELAPDNGPKPANFAAAEKAVGALDGAIGIGQKLIAKNKKHGAYVGAMKRKVPGFRAQILRLRFQTNVANHRSRVVAATEKVSANMEELQQEAPKEDDFEQAVDAVEQLAAVVESGKELGEKDKRYRLELVAVRRKAAGYKAAIERRRIELKVTVHRAKVEAANATVVERLEGLAENPKPIDFKAADDAVHDLAKVLEGAAIAQKDKKYAGFVAGMNRKVNAYRAQIVRRRFEINLAAHRAKVEKAKAVVAEHLESLEGQPNPSRYQATEEVISDLMKEIERGDELRAKDKKYAAYLAAATRAIPGYRIEIRRKRVTAAQATLQQRMEALEGEPAESSFGAAENAVRLLTNTIQAAQKLAPKNKGYQKEMALASRKIGGFNAAIARRRTEVEVAKHRAEVERAAAAVEEAMEALEEEPARSAFDKAESAVEKLESEVDSGEPVGKKDKKYRIFLAGLKKKIGGYRGRIKRGRVQAEIRPHRTKVEEGLSALAEQVGGLSDESESGTFSAARDQADRLLAKVDQGKSFEAKSPAYKKVLAVNRKKVAGLKAQIGRVENAAKLRAHTTKLEAANSALEDRLGAMEEGEDALRAAQDAVDVLKSVIDEGKPLSARNRKYAARLAGLRRTLPGHLVTIKQTRITQANAKVVERMEALKGEPNQAAFEAAEAAVNDLEKSVEGAKDFANASKDKKFKRFFLGMQKRVPSQRALIKRRQFQLVLNAHTQKVEAALSSAQESIGELEGSESGAFRVAEDAVDSYEKIVEAGAKLADRSPKHKKYVAASRRKVPAMKRQIEQRRVAKKISAHRMKLEVATGVVRTMLEGLEEAKDPSKYQEAEDGISGLKKQIEEGDELASNKKYAAYLAGARRGIPAMRMELRRKRVGSARAMVETRFEALSEEKPAEAAFGAAEHAIRLLENTVDAALKFDTKDKGFKKEMGAAKRAVGGYRARVTRRRNAVEIAGHRSQVEAAVAQLEERMGALQSEGAKAGDFDEAEEAIQSLQSELDSGEPFAKKNKKYGAYLASHKKKIGGYNAAIKRGRIEAEVRPHRTKVQAGLDALAEKIDNLGENTSGFASVKESITDLLSTIDDGKALGEKSKAYVKFLNGSRKKVNGFKARVNRLELNVQLAAHRTKMEAVSSTLDERMGALEEGDAGAFSSAEEAIAEMRTVLQAGAALAKRNKKYGKQLAAIRRSLPGHAVNVKKQRLIKANALCTERLGALSESNEQAAFEAAEKAVKGLEEALEATQDLGDARDKKVKRFYIGMSKKVPAHRSAMKRRKIAIVTSAHRQKVEAAQASVSESIGSLGEDAESGAFRVAEDAVEDLGKIIDAGTEISKRSPKHRKFLAGARKALPRYRAQVARARVAKKVVAHRAKVEEVSNAVDGKLEALEGQPDPSQYQATEDAISDLKKLLEEGEEYAEKDKGYGKYLAAARRSIPARRMELRRKRVNAARAAVDSALEALGEDQPKEAAFGAASNQVRLLENTIDAAVKFQTKDKKYKKQMAGAAKFVKVARVRIKRREAAVEVAEHRAKVETAANAVSERMAALMEGGKPASDFDEAEEAVATLESELDSGEPFAAKSKPYKKYLAAQRKKLKGYSVALKRGRIEAELAPHRRSVQEALAALAERIDGLRGGGQSFDAAREAIDDFNTLIDKGEPFGEKSKRYKKFLAAARKKSKGLRVQIGRIQVAAEREVHRGKMEQATAALEEKMGALEDKPNAPAYAAAEEAVEELRTVLKRGAKYGKGNKQYKAQLIAVRRDIPAHFETIKRSRVNAAKAVVAERMEALNDGPDAAAFGAAEEAVKALAEVVKECGDFAKKNKKFKKFLVPVRKSVPKSRARIKQRKFAMVLDAHRAKVEEAGSGVSEALGRLAEEPEEGTFRVAADAIEELEQAVDAGAQLAKRSKKHKKYLASVQKEIPRHKREIEKRRAAKQIASHRAEVEEINNSVQQKLEKLDGEPDPSLYQRTEDTISDLKKLIEEGESLADRDPDYSRELKSMRKDIPSYRIAIRRKRISNALNTVEQRMEALTGDEVEQSAFGAAEHAIRLLHNTVESSKKLNTKNKEYKKYIVSASKRVKSYRVKIKRRRASIEIEGHRAEVLDAENAVNTRMEALSGESEESDFDAAEEALENLQEAIEGGEPFAKKNKAYKKQLGKLRKAIKGHRRRVKGMKAQAAIAPHRAKVQKALANVYEKLDALEGEPSGDAFSDAMAAVEDLQTVIERGESAAEKSKKHKKYLKGLTKKVKGFKGRIRRARAGVAAAKNRSRIAEAVEAMEEKIAALDDEAGESAQDAAKEAIAELSEVIKESKPLAKKNKKFKKVLAAARKRLKEGRRAISGRKSAGVRQAIEEAHASLAEKVDALRDDPKPDAFDEVGDAVKTLEEALDNARPLAKRNKKLKKYLRKMRKEAKSARSNLKRLKVKAQSGGHRARVEAALSAAADAVESLSAESSKSDFGDARERLEDLDSVLAEGKSLSKRSKKYKRYLASVRKKGRRLRKRITSGRMELVVSSHRTQLRSALENAAEAIATNKSERSEASYDAAREAISELKTVIAEGKPFTKKSRKYKKTLSAAKKKLKKYTKSLKRNRPRAAAAEAGPELQQLKEAWGNFKQARNGLKKRATLDDYDSALDLAKEVSTILKDNKRSRDRKYRKYAKKVKRSYSKSIKKIKKSRKKKLTTLQIKALKKARAYLKKMTKRLRRAPDEADVDAAEAAADDLERILDEGAALRIKSKKYKSLAKKAKKQLKKARKSIRRRR